MTDPVEAPAPARAIRISTNSMNRLVPDLERLPTFPTADTVDATLVTGHILGHDDLARDLSEFVMLWEQRIDELARHLDALRQEAATALSRYQEVDELAGCTFVALGSSR